MKHNKYLATITLGLMGSSLAQADFIDLVEQFESPIAIEVAQRINERFAGLQGLGCGRVIIDETDTVQIGEETIVPLQFDEDGSRLVLGEGGDLPITIADTQGIPISADCSGRTLRVFNNIDALIQTGNALTQSNLPTQRSLGLTVGELEEALIWVAADEYAAQGDMSRNFASNQASGLGSRLDALRAGATGFRVSARHNSLKVDSLAKSEQALVGSRGAGASSEATYSPLGGYLNVQFSDGSRDDGDFENAFELSGINVNAGVDYRFNSQWIAGVNIGYTDQKIEFDPNKSVVDGDINSDGFSIMPFAMYQYGQFFSSISLGSQQLTFDSSRAIQFADVDTRSVSETDSTVNTFFFELGYSIENGRFTIEPYLNINRSQIEIDGFVEQDVNNSGYNVAVAEQNLDLLDVTLGLSLQTIFTAGNKVFLPYFTIEQVNQTEDQSRTVSSNFFSGEAFSDSAFGLDTEQLDSSYLTYTLGLSSVIRGSRQKTDGGAFSGQIQGYAEIKTVSGYANYHLTLYSLGARMSF